MNKRIFNHRRGKVPPADKERGTEIREGTAGTKSLAS